MRTYELAIVADPRLTDEEFVSLVDETKQLISSRGGEIVHELQNRGPCPRQHYLMTR